MNAVALTGIKDILTDTYRLHGWDIPNYIVDYESRILAERLDKNPWQPEPSYAERYLSIRTQEQAVELANTCFFTRTVFPELGKHRGINSSYYVQLGQSCYSWALDRGPLQNPTLAVMRDHFEFLAEAAYTAIRHYGDFRSMWD